MNLIFNKKTTKFIETIAKNAQKQNIRVFFVGGLVRDFILKKEIKDIDFLIEGNAIDFIKKIPEIKIKSIHEPFGTLKAELDDETFDIASTRKESYPYSGVLPVVEKLGVNIEEDVKRRDFSVNSLYIQIEYKENLEYKLIDLINSTKDINDKNLKVLHPKSYIDDPSRIIRGLGFKHRFNFDFSKEDKILIKEYFKNPDLTHISYDRLYDVFKYVLNNEFTDSIFEEIIENKYYKIIFNSEIKIDKNNLNETLKEILLSQEEKADFYLKILENKEVEQFSENTPIKIVEYFSKLKPADLAYYYYKTQDKKIKLLNQYKNIKLNISGNDLIKLSYPKGKLFGEILDDLLNQKMLTPTLFKNKDDEINWVLKSYPLK